MAEQNNHGLIKKQGAITLKKPSENKIAIKKFMVDFSKKHLDFPSAERVAHEFPGVTFENASTIVNSLISGGDLADAAAEMKLRRKNLLRAANTNRPDDYTASIVRTGVKELSKKVIEAKSYPVDVLKAKFEDGMIYKYAFIVDHSRGFNEYLAVKNQNIEPSFSEYSSDLLNGMFKNWN